MKLSVRASNKKIRDINMENISSPGGFSDVSYQISVPFTAEQMVIQKMIIHRLKYIPFA
jgi:hypothetical protein